MRLPQSTVGQRIKDAREKASLTQQDIAKFLGQTRSSVAQWESDVTSASVDKLSLVARLINESDNAVRVTPQWLAYGIDGEPEVIVRVPDGTVELREVTFGDTVTEQHPSGSWSVPTSYLKNDLHVAFTEGLLIWRAESDSMSPSYEYGDRLIIDTNSKRVTPPGVFLIWDGVGPNLVYISVIQASDTKQMARVSTSTGGGGDKFETEVGKLNIIGRVRGRIHAS